MKIVMFALLAACGRINFDPLADATTTPNDVITTDSATGVCATMHTFCDNFDRRTPAEAAWTGALMAGGPLTITSDTFTSPPQSLLVNLAFPLTGFAYLQQTLPIATTTIHLAFDLALEATTPQIAEVDLVQLVWESPPAPCTAFGYFFVRDSTNVFVMQETYTNCGGNVNTTLPFAGTGFHHVEMDITIGPANGGRVVIMIDGTMVFDKQPTLPIPAAALSLKVGVASARDTTAAWRLRYDDVVVDLQ